MLSSLFLKCLKKLNESQNNQKINTVGKHKFLDMFLTPTLTHLNIETSQHSVDAEQVLHSAVYVDAQLCVCHRRL